MRTLLLSALTVVFCATTVTAADPVAKPKIKLGVSTALSGEGTTWGFDVRDTIMFAAEQLAPGKFEIILEDDKCAPKEAVTVAHKFIESDKVDYVLGLACSSAMIASAPLYERAKIPTITVSASSPAISSAGDYIFRTFPGDALAAKLLYSKMSARFKNIGIISQESSYCQDFKKAFVAENSAQTVKISTADYLPETTDFRSLLGKLRASKIDALFVNTQYETTFDVILRQMKQLDWHPAIFGAYWPSSPALMQLAKENLNGVEFVDTPALSAILDRKGQALYEAYVKQYGKIRSIEAVFAASYEAVNALNQAINSGKDIRDFLYHTKFQGIFGPWSFDSNGDIQGLEFSYKKVENGKVVTLP